MAQFVLLFRGEGASDDVLRLIHETPGLRVVDQTFNRAMLVDASPDALSALSGQLKGWIVAEEVAYDRPERAPLDVDRETS